MLRICILVILALTLAGSQAQAQTYNEWFRQRRTQMRYLVQQIVELQVYLGYVKKGYDIAQSGLSTVRAIRNGEWDLHKVFFSSLSQVNPKIRGYEKIARIIENQQYVLNACTQGWKAVKKTGQYNDKELDYCYKVFNNLLDQSVRNVDDLMTVITDSRLEMTDDERIDRIDKIYLESQSQQVFATSFNEDLHIQALQRLSGTQNAARSRILHGIKPEP